MTEPARPSPRLPLLLGFAFLLLGAIAAFWTLPEWQPLSETNPDDLFVALRARLSPAGATLVKPRIRLSAPRSYEESFRLLGPEAPQLGIRYGASVGTRVEGSLEVRGAGIGPAGLELSREGRLVSLTWWPEGGSIFGMQPSEPIRRAREEFAGAIAAQMMDPERPASPPETFPGGTGSFRIQALATATGAPRESITTSLMSPALVDVSRSLSDPDLAKRFTAATQFRKASLAVAKRAVLVVLVFVLFGVLLFRRRLSVRIAFVLGILALSSMAIGAFGVEVAGSGLTLLAPIFLRVMGCGFLILLWIVAESLVRETVPGFTTSLDALVARRLGPRSGIALLAGLGAGAGIAGARLLLSSGASRLAGSGIWPVKPSFTMPLFGGTESAFFQGPYETAVFVLFVALARFVLRRDRADVAGAVIAALVLSAGVPIHPWLGAFLGALLVSALFLLVFRRFGFASLLVAATSAALFRDALAAGRFPSGNVFPLFVSVVSLGGIALAGFIGKRRPAKDDDGRIDAPEYVRRIESERRVKYEMDLLSRMQLDLLPEHPPAVDGLELSVRTVLATEAGGDLYNFVVDDRGALWVAAGDVSGHGYSCGIQGAMVMAALASLIKAERVPSEILSEIHRVLRCGRRSRLFTSLALLKIDPRTGKGLLANAGHPFPLLLVEGRCVEIPGSGLPLGQGPARTYTDQPIEIAEGGTLVFASDGLFEGPDRFDEPYGYDRPRAVLEGIGLWRRPAEAILESLIADWRIHIGEGAPADDTTILVVRRPASLSW